MDVDTFVAFAQYLYSGDYTPLNSIAIAASPEDSTQHAKVSKFSSNDLLQYLNTSDDDVSGSYGGSMRYGEKKKNKKLSKKGIEDECLQKYSRPNGFRRLTYEIPSTSTLASSCTVCSAYSKHDDCGLVFLHHARLYTLADKWDINQLKSLALQKLHKSLIDFEISEARYTDVVDLVRFAYENTPDRPEIDDLRELVSAYVAFEAPQIATSGPCPLLIEECGAFARDIIILTMGKQDGS